MSSSEVADAAVAVAVITRRQRSSTQHYGLKQCFSISGMRRVVWWYVRILNYYLFHNSIFKMLIALLKSFSIYLNVKKNIYKV
jgi:hypothetical protein